MVLECIVVHTEELGGHMAVDYMGTTCIEEVMVDFMEVECMVGVVCIIVVLEVMGGYGMGMKMGGPYGDQDPNNLYGPPSSLPSLWVSLMRMMQGVVGFFGRIAILIDQNTQAFHMFMTALFQLFVRSGMLYGELARFVLKILGIRTKPKKISPPGPSGLRGPQNNRGRQHYIEAPKTVPSGAWDSVCGDNTK